MDPTCIQPAPVHMRCGDALVVVSTARRRHRAAKTSEDEPERAAALHQREAAADPCSCTRVSSADHFGSWQ